MKELFRAKKESKSLSPDLLNLKKQEIVQGGNVMKQYISVEKFSSNQVSPENFHRPISKIVVFGK